jgi:hypothetical protein
MRGRCSRPWRCRALVLVSACSGRMDLKLPARFFILKLIARWPFVANYLLGRAAGNPPRAAERSIADPQSRDALFADAEAATLFAALQATIAGRLALAGHQSPHPGGPRHGRPGGRIRPGARGGGRRPPGGTDGDRRRRARLPVHPPRRRPGARSQLPEFARARRSLVARAMRAKYDNRNYVTRALSSRHQ